MRYSFQGGTGAPLITPMQSQSPLALGFEYIAERLVSFKIKPPLVYLLIIIMEE
ncbi:unnamed protein product [Dovyalis caffra]|uniref:Uncharacterized protein n=1 Tax=Dovyalis caffra TaxID=77055 RepID=A0AAV1QYX1_9ROSI|nr:unnamed protein product [Dovyalis caffra]